MNNGLMRFQLTGRRGRAVAVLGFAFVATAITACSSTSSSSASPTAPASSSASAAAAPASPSGASSAAAVEAITTNWNLFFSHSTPNSKRVQLLQNGTQFSSAITAFTSSPLASAVTSKVDSVTLTTTTQATVKYDLSAVGTPVATGASGTSVLQDGVWKIGDAVFCDLLTQAKSAGLTLPIPAACGSAG
jgi:hypothetical protein